MPSACSSMVRRRKAANHAVSVFIDACSSMVRRRKAANHAVSVFINSFATHLHHGVITEHAHLTSQVRGVAHGGSAQSHDGTSPTVIGAPSRGE
eukprot:gene48660-54737_t